MPVDRLRLGVTVGDTAGIGLEVLYGALQSQNSDMVEYILYAHPKSVESYYNTLFGSNNWKLPKTVHIEQCGVFSPIHFAKQCYETAVSAIESLSKAAIDAKNGSIEAIVTLPISKSVLQSVGWNYPRTDGVLCRF